MTRNFDKHRRDDERPDSRNSSSGRYGEERPPRPARPRLNRNVVDRAWESGARPNHADYHTRSPHGPHNAQHSQPSRDNWRNQQQSDQPSAQSGRDNRRPHKPYKPYGNRQDENRHSERAPNRYQGSRPFESGMRKFDEQQYEDRRSHTPRPAGETSRPGYRDTPHYPNDRPPAREYNRDNERGYRRPFEGNERSARPYNRDERPPRRFERDDRPTRPYNRDERPPRRFERDEQDSRSPHGFDRGRRQGRDEGRPDPQNPRWQSRPERFTPKPRQFRSQEPRREQFEGDYEHFDAPNALPEVDERHVTRLPDGRVLKGPREVQKRDAEFWTGVNEDTASLVQHIEPAVKSDEPEAATEPSESVEQVESAPSEKKRKARTHTASSVVRGRKSSSKKKATGAGSAKPKPSQRGYKWPTAE
jgi:hypothetical protein